MHDDKTEIETEKREKQRQRISLFVDTLRPVSYKGLIRTINKLQPVSQLFCKQVNQTTIL